VQLPALDAVTGGEAEELLTGVPVVDVAPADGKAFEAIVIELGRTVVYSVNVSCEFPVLETFNKLDVRDEEVVMVGDGVNVLVVEVFVGEGFDVEAAAAPDCREGSLLGPSVAEGSVEK